MSHYPDRNPPPVVWALLANRNDVDKVTRGIPAIRVDFLRAEPDNTIRDRLIAIDTDKPSDVLSALRSDRRVVGAARSNYSTLIR